YCTACIENVFIAFIYGFDLLIEIGIILRQRIGTIKPLESMQSGCYFRRIRKSGFVTTMMLRYASHVHFLKASRVKILPRLTDLPRIDCVQSLHSHYSAVSGPSSFPFPFVLLSMLCHPIVPQS